MRILFPSNIYSSTFFKRLSYSKNITTYVCDNENYNVNNLSNKNEIMDKYQKELQKLFKNNDNRIKELRESLYISKKKIIVINQFIHLNTNLELKYFQYHLFHPFPYYNTFHPKTFRL